MKQSDSQVYDPEKAKANIGRRFWLICVRLAKLCFSLINRDYKILIMPAGFRPKLFLWFLNVLDSDYDKPIVAESKNQRRL